VITPTAVIAHDRPEHLRLTLDHLARCDGLDQCPVTIFCDAPRTSANADRAQATQRVAQEWADQHNGTVVVRSENLCYGNLTQAVSQLCDAHGSAIVFEDDVVPSTDALLYFRSSLLRYEHDPRVYNICGSAIFGIHPPKPTTFFLPGFHPCGWATWKRAWDHFTWHPPDWKERLYDPQFRRRWDFDGKWRQSDWFEKCMHGHLSAWDPIWAYHTLANDAYSLYPHQTLVFNTGLGCGMMNGNPAPNFNGVDDYLHGNLSVAHFEKPRLPQGWTYPEEVTTHTSAYKRCTKFFRIQRRNQRCSKRLASKTPLAV
jgi:hypothetical protein